MDIAEVLVPIFVCLGLFAMVFGIFYMQKRENLAMIEKGMNPKEPRPAPYKNLKWGLLLVGEGLSLLIASILDQTVFINTHNTRRDNDNVAIYFSLIAIGGGFGLIASYRVEKKELLDRNRRDQQ